MVLREQFEAAQRQAEAHGTVAGIVEVSARVDVALDHVRSKLRGLRDAGGPVRELRLLVEELDDLKRLREHIKYLLGASGR